MTPAETVYSQTGIKSVCADWCIVLDMNSLDSISEVVTALKFSFEVQFIFDRIVYAYFFQNVPNQQD